MHCRLSTLHKLLTLFNSSPLHSPSSSSSSLPLQIAMERYGGGAAVAASFHGGNSSFLYHHSTFKKPPAISSLRPAASGGTAARWGLRSTADTELGIFAAERYFSEGHDAIPAERCSLSSHRKDTVVVDGYGQYSLAGSSSSVPTASSDAIWNSQSSLLSFPPGSAAASARASLSFKESGKSPPSSASRRRLFACKCPCTGKRSVDVEERLADGIKNRNPSGFGLKTSFAAKTRSFRTGEAGLCGIPETAIPEAIKNEFGVEDMIKVKIAPGNYLKNPNFLGSSTRFSLERPFSSEFGRPSSILFAGSGGSSFPSLSSYSSKHAEEPPLASLEAIRPMKLTTSVLSRPPEQQRLAAVFPLSVDPAIPPPSADDDEASDTSSDLFEIESFSTQTTYRRGDSLEEAAPPPPPPPPPPPSDVYAPSEASVEWSVSTAEGFDRESLTNFSSAASDHGEPRCAKAEEARKVARKPRSLLGCRSTRAVSVGTKPNRVRSVWG